jgi:hypothetical protein
MDFSLSRECPFPEGFLQERSTPAVRHILFGCVKDKRHETEPDSQ